MNLYDQYPLQITNSLSGLKENFVPQTPGFVGMYVCGPTVYNKVHLGNARTFLTFDIVARYLRRLDLPDLKAAAMEDPRRFLGEVGLMLREREGA